MTKILLVEDEEKISKIITSYLEKNEYQVIKAFDGLEALEKFDSSIDLIILDRMLPKLSGEDFLKEVRKISDLPVIMVTAKVSEEDKIEGFRLGVDDYVTKPFSPMELIERVKAILRRSGISSNNIKSYDQGRLKVNFDLRQVFVNEKLIDLTLNEFDILKVIISNPNKIFTREEIITLVYGLDYDSFNRAIDTHVKNIRRKIEENPKNPNYIKTVYGVGYRAGDKIWN